MSRSIDQLETQIQTLPQNVTVVPTAELKPRLDNPRTHPEKQLRQIVKSYQKFGYLGLIVTDENDTILSGHARVAAAKRLGLEVLPVLQIDHLSEEQKRAFVIADNKLALNAGWDMDLLKAGVTEILAFEPDFDFEAIGIETPELDILLTADSGETDPADEIPEHMYGSSVTTRVDDIWGLGPHRLGCFDALREANYRSLLMGKTAQAVFIDPPFNVPIAGHVSGLGRVQHPDFAMASGEMSTAEYRDFLEAALRYLARWSDDGSVHFVCIDWRHIADLLAAGDSVFDKLLNICVWVKTNGGMGSLYRSQHELVTVFKKGTTYHTNNVELGKHGRNRTNIWRYAGVNTFRDGRMEDLKMHPTVKPVALIEDAIKDVSRRGHIVLDSFVGSGTTIIAAERCGRVAYAMEIAPGYVDVAVRRWQAFTGQEAVHAETGETFNDVTEIRRAEAEGGSDV